LQADHLQGFKRLGIEPTKRRGANNRGQIIAYITREEARVVVGTLRPVTASSESSGEDSPSTPEVLLAEQGVFYLLLLEPKTDAGRFKVGFATNLPERLRQLRCSAPFTVVIATWPCKRLWERTAIECVTEGCERIHTEVFRTISIESLRQKCEQFFALMPKIGESVSSPRRR